MLKIYGTFFSAPSNKVRLAASALDLEYEYHELDLAKGEHKSSEFIKINPVGKVPAIDDEGFRLFESDAIIRYLARKTESQLYPQDNKARAQIDQWIEFAYNHILVNMGMVLFNRRFATSMGTTPNEQSIAAGEKYLNQYLPLIEKQFANTPYICGAEMSLADIALLASIEPFQFADIDIAAYPAIKNWIKGLMQQNFYQRVHTHYAAEIEKKI